MIAGLVQDLKCQQAVKVGGQRDVRGRLMGCLRLLADSNPRLTSGCLDSCSGKVSSTQPAAPNGRTRGFCAAIGLQPPRAPAMSVHRRRVQSRCPASIGFAATQLPGSPPRRRGHAGSHSTAVRGCIALLNERLMWRSHDLKPPHPLQRWLLPPNATGSPESFRPATHAGGALPGPAALRSTNSPRHRRPAALPRDASAAVASEAIRPRLSGRHPADL